MKKTLSPALFKRHITKEIRTFLDYTFCNLNPRSPSSNIRDLLSDINKASGGVVCARLKTNYWTKERTVEFTLRLPTEWRQTIDKEAD
jgi:hypothetical protein